MYEQMFRIRDCCPRCNNGLALDMQCLGHMWKIRKASAGGKAERLLLGGRCSDLRKKKNNHIA